MRNSIVFASIAAMFAGVLVVSSDHGASKATAYAYRTQPFDKLVADSYAFTSSGDHRAFYQSWEDSFQKVAGQSLTSWIAAAKDRLSGSTNRAKAEREIGENLHAILKKAIPKFSLDRGFEFSTVPVTHERQCLLQSVLISSILQSVGLKAGVVMVWANEQGQTSNLGHVSAFIRLADGKSTLIDASEPHAHAVHKGLFLSRSDGQGYAFVKPNYDRQGDIVRFTTPSGNVVSGSSLSVLDLAYVRSQFDFYRGERAPHGFLASDKTDEGVRSSLRAFQSSLHENPLNPLSAACLARTFLMSGDKKSAAETLATARRLYTQFGWTPPDLPRQF